MNKLFKLAAVRMFIALTFPPVLVVALLLRLGSELRSTLFILWCDARGVFGVAKDAWKRGEIP